MEFPPRHPRGVVLVVDDEIHVCRYVSRTLEPHGFDVIQAHSGEEALELFARFGKRIDVVILDIVLPGLDGEEVFRELRNWNPDVRVLFSSGHPDSPALTRLGSQPGTDLLDKPYQPAELVHTVETLLRAREPRRKTEGST